MEITGSGGQRGTYKNGRETRQQIVDASSALFARHGYTGASLREIAREVGVTPGALNRHFAGKPDLLLAVLDQWSRDTQTVVEGAGVGRGREFFLGLVPLMQYHVDHPGLIELFLTICAEASNADHPAHDWARSRYERTIANGAEELRAAGLNGDAITFSARARNREMRYLFALMDGLELQWIAQPDLDLVGTFAAALTRTLHGWGVHTQHVEPPPSLLSRTNSSAHTATPSPCASTRRGPYRNGIERRERILEEAGRFFAQHGYAGTSLRNVAERVGVTSAAILRHFGSKDGLLLAVLDRWDRDNSAARESAARTGNRVLDAFPTVMASHPDRPGFVELFLTIATESSDHTHPARNWIAERYGRITLEVMEQLSSSAAEGLIRPMTDAAREFEARCLYAVMDGLELQWIADPSIDLVGLFDAYFTAVIETWRIPANE